MRVRVGVCDMILKERAMRHNEDPRNQWGTEREEKEFSPFSLPSLLQALRVAPRTGSQHCAFRKPNGSKS